MAAIPFETTLRYIRGLVQRDTSGRQPDRDLVDRVASGGDQAAFAELLERHGAMVRGVCLRMLGNGADADDAFQATFLVLARKAGTIRCHESLAGWLYRVAYRLACRTRSTTRQRQLHESQAVEPVCADPADEITWSEVRQVIDEELQRQPARYRDPLVLCYLEGLSQEEAARQLGWRVGVLRGRLDRGRQRLRRRLEHRGITGAGALGATLLVNGSTTAGVPAGLRSATLQAAASFARNSGARSGGGLGGGDAARAGAGPAKAGPGFVADGDAGGHRFGGAGASVDEGEISGRTGG